MKIQHHQQCKQRWRLCETVWSEAIPQIRTNSSCLLKAQVEYDASANINTCCRRGIVHLKPVSAKRAECFYIFSGEEGGRDYGGKREFEGEKSGNVWKGRKTKRWEEDRKWNVRTDTLCGGGEDLGGKKEVDNPKGRRVISYEGVK